MRTTAQALLLGLLVSLGCVAQSSNPDCQFTASFTSTSTTNTAISNRGTATGGTPCIYWVFTYWTNGASGVSVKLEGTNDVSGAAGVSFAALTAAAGTSNPATGTNEGSAILCCDSYPWVRMNASTFTGTSQTMIVRVYGWRTTPGPGAGGSSIGSNVNVAQWGGTNTALGQAVMASSVPVVIASNQSSIPVTSTPSGTGDVNLKQVNGTTVDTNANGDQGVINSCTTFAAFNLSGSGNTQIVALSAAKKIIVCSLYFSTIAPEDIKFTEGTGSNCGTGTADAGGLLKQVTALAHDALGLPYTATAGDALCINQSVAQALGGTIWYRYQ